MVLCRHKDEQIRLLQGELSMFKSRLALEQRASRMGSPAKLASADVSVRAFTEQLQVQKATLEVSPLFGVCTWSILLDTRVKEDMPSTMLCQVHQPPICPLTASCILQRSPAWLLPAHFQLMPKKVSPAVRTHSACSARLQTSHRAAGALNYRTPKDSPYGAPSSRVQASRAVDIAIVHLAAGVQCPAGQGSAQAATEL